MGDKYLRRLLVVGMTSLVRRAKYKPDAVDRGLPPSHDYGSQKILPFSHVGGVMTSTSGAPKGRDSRHNWFLAALAQTG